VQVALAGNEGSAGNGDGSGDGSGDDRTVHEEFVHHA
jgi:hypothetical protein